MNNTATRTRDTEQPNNTVVSAAGHKIVIRSDWFPECRKAGLETELDKAKAFGVSRATIARAHAGGDCKSLIAAALAVLGCGKFNLLFRVTS